MCLLLDHVSKNTSQNFCLDSHDLKDQIYANFSISKLNRSPQVQIHNINFSLNISTWMSIDISVQAFPREFIIPLHHHPQTCSLDHIFHQNERQSFLLNFDV